MILAASFFIIFGIVIFLAPQILAYIVGSVFLMIGVNLLIVGLRMNRFQKKGSGQSFSFGGYEVIRKRK